MKAERPPIVVLGAGPAGLGAAYKLASRGCLDVTVIERGSLPGGNAGSFEMAGLRVDYGSHRLHPACAPEILGDIQSMLGEDLLDRPRHGRIRLRGRWVHFPLKPLDLAAHLPPSFITGVAADSLRKLGGGADGEETFEGILERGLGRTICRDFYFPYARKIWGLAPAELDAEQARRRVSAGSLGKMVRKALNAVPGLKPRGAGRFYYPRDGYGAISEAYSKAAQKAGARICFETEVEGIEIEQGRAARVRVRSRQGRALSLPARQILSTIPVTSLARTMEPQAPQPVLDSASALRFRAMILVYLTLETGQFTEFDAHYFPDADISITRLSEPKNYGLASAAGVTVLCAELPCFANEAIWSATDDQLKDVLLRDLARAGIPVRAAVRQVASRRLAQAYPLYTRDYRGHFDRVDDWLNRIEGVLTFGRQGLFAHDNTHHALAMAYAADKCLDDSGALDRTRWQDFRLAFQKHVVED